MTVFNTGPHANTTDFRAGDVGLVRRNCGHYVENTGDDDLVFIETFRSDHYEEVSLANWLSHLPPKLVSAHLNIPEETLAKFPRGARGIVPLPYSCVRAPIQDAALPTFPTSRCGPGLPRRPRWLSGWGPAR